MTLPIFPATWREIQTQGYPGQRSILRDYLTCLRKRQGLPPCSRSGGANSRVVPPRKPPTLQTLTWLIIGHTDILSAEEAADVAHAREAHPDVAMATSLAQDFTAMLRNRQPDRLDAWLDRAAASRLVPFGNFAKSLRQDQAAVRAALTLEWSQGPVEGHINRLKLLKRQSYGRAKLDLLRVRLLDGRSVSRLQGSPKGRMSQKDVGVDMRV